MMKLEINKQNIARSHGTAYWIVGLLSQLVLWSPCTTVLAESEATDEPSQAQPGDRAEEEKPDASGLEPTPSEQSPETPGGFTGQETPASEPAAQPSQPQLESPPALDKTDAAQSPRIADQEQAGRVDAKEAHVSQHKVVKRELDREEGREPPVPESAMYREVEVCANGRPAVENERSQWPPIRLRGDLGFGASSRSGDTSVWLSPLLGGWFRVMDMVAISVDWGFAYLNRSASENSAKTAFRMGNPFLAVHSVRQHGCTELRVGIGATIPLAYLPDPDYLPGAVEGERNLVVETYQGAMAMRGMWNWWLWVPDSMSVALPVSWESAANTDWIFGGEVALASTVFLEGRYAYFVPVANPLQALLVIPMAGKIGYRISPFILSIRLQAIWVVNDGAVQLAAIPAANWKFGIGFLDISFNLNLDKPYGFGAENDRQGKLWGVQLGGGIEY
ncbi:MAG: hypothetical protein JXA30_12935 [Deltaproteobacteria bacterium]|nr:hypothetical protein [Deltaproteobacteria bacterium]